MNDAEIQQELDELLQGASPEQLLDDVIESLKSHPDWLPDDEVIDLDVDDDDDPLDTPIIHVPAVPRYKVDVTDVKLDKDYERLVRMTQVFGKFASTLLSRRVKVDLHMDMHNGPDAPAWSDSESITFNRHKIGKLDNRAVVTSLRGLALHEISHILLTPRDGTQLVKMVRQAKVWPAFNALEDMRIETYMTARYSNVSDWLTATIAEFLLKEPNQIPYQFPLVYGRKYLPSDIRIMVRDAYQQQQDVAELQQLIDNYIVLNLADPANYKDAFAIILRYSELVNNLQADPNNPRGCTGWDVVIDSNGHTKRPVGEWKPNNGKTLNKVQQNAIAQRIKVDNGAAYDAPPAPADPADPMPHAPTDGSSSAGSTSDPEKNMDTLKGVLTDIYKRRSEDITDTIKQFNGDTELNSKSVPVPPVYYRRTDKPVLPEAVNASRSFGTELEQLRGEYDPSWTRRVSSGRLNVQRYLTEHDVDEAFDQWDMGREDAVDIECVVLLDISGSMQWCIDNAYQSMWAIKRALDKVNASTTVVAFDTEAYMLYRADERAGIEMRYSGTGGGTDPKQAIDYAQSVLAQSERAIKVLINITDGDWYNSGDVDAIIGRLRQSGVVTSLAYVSPPARTDGDTIRINNHGCEVAVNITDASDLFNLARKLVKVGVARNLA